MGHTGEVVTVLGAQPVELPRCASTVTDRDLVTREITFECASERLVRATWTGIPMDLLFETAAMPPDTTHLVFESTDGYRTCLPVVDLAEGVLAYDADDETMAGFPRVVSPSVPGPRSSKDVVEIRPIALAAAEDAAAYEALDFVGT